MPEFPIVKDADSPTLHPGLHLVTVLGFGVVALMVIVLIAWSAYAPLESVAVAPGSVIVEFNRKTIKHLQGGIVSKIYVAEGDTVTAGQTLIKLDETQASAQLELLRNRRATATARDSRLIAEQQGSDRIAFPGWFREGRIQTRTRIVAPLDGTVVGLQIHTPGGVVRAGEPLVSIIPSADRMIVEAQINPSDIDVVRAGLAARVNLTPFSARHTNSIRGKVISVSADSLVQERNGTSYFLARIELNDDSGTAAPTVPLYPGMPARVTIVTGRHTTIDYFLKPLARSFNAAFREE